MSRRPPSASSRQAAGAPQQVRILGGQWRRTPLDVPLLDGLRPTSSRVRETLYNWLGQDLSGWRVLDAFAGSGALGLEAASRGAANTVLLEQRPELVKALRAVVQRLKATALVEVQQTDALDWMARPAAQQAFDLVLLDPPFAQDLFERAMAAAEQCVPPEGWIYVESPHEVSSPDGLVLRRHGRAGQVHFHLFQRKGAEGDGVVS